MSDGRSDTVLSYFVRTRKESEQPVEVRSWQYLAGAGVGPSDRMVAYDPDMRFVRHMISQEFIQLPPQLRNETYVVNCRAKTCGVVCPPEAILDDLGDICRTFPRKEAPVAKIIEENCIGSGCELCINVCPFDALHWSPEHSYAGGSIAELTHERGRLAGWEATAPQPADRDA
mgnify:CR=1 FL=1